MLDSVAVVPPDLTVSSRTRSAVTKNRFNAWRDTSAFGSSARAGIDAACPVFRIATEFTHACPGIFDERLNRGPSTVLLAIAAQQ